MNKLNSDQLRERLSGNNLKMNALTAENDTIVSTLKQRGLQAVEKTADEDLVFSADKMIFFNAGGAEVFNTDWPNPFVSPNLPIPVINPESNRKIALTAEELKAGGWWCADVSEECRLALIDNGASVTSYRWIGNANVQCAYKPDSESNVLRAHVPVVLDNLKQIHRIGNSFFWGAPE